MLEEHRVAALDERVVFVFLNIVRHAAVRFLVRRSHIDHGAFLYPLRHGVSCVKPHAVGHGGEFLGVELDKEVNAKTRGEEAVLSTPNSRVKVLLIPTDEELMIATDTYDIIKGMK